MVFFSILGIIIILGVFTDAFETIILPRRVNRRIRLARIFYWTSWKLWIKGKKLFKSVNDMKDYLGVFGPLSLIILITIWAIALIFGFALVNFGAQTAIRSPYGAKDFITYLNLSGCTFFPVGISDIYPLYLPGKFYSIIEGGTGFAFLAMVIGYLPVLYQGFSRREVSINLLDSRAGSPPNAVYLLAHSSKYKLAEQLMPQLEDWEKWCAELLETQISYPVLAYYRSQHDNQSWVGALLMILDATTLILASQNEELHVQAKSTFAIARHAAVDLTQSFYLTPKSPPNNRMSKTDLAALQKTFSESGFEFKQVDKTEKKLLFLRNLYEPYIQALSNFFLMPITPFIIADGEIEEAWRKNI